MPPTMLFLGALPVAGDWCHTALFLQALRDVLAGHVHESMTTTTLDGRHLLTGGTWPHMADTLTFMGV